MCSKILSSKIINGGQQTSRRKRKTVLCTYTKKKILAPQKRKVQSHQATVWKQKHARTWPSGQKYKPTAAIISFIGLSVTQELKPNCATCIESLSTKGWHPIFFGSMGAIKTLNTFGYSLERRFYHTATSPSKNRQTGGTATGKCTGRVSPWTLYNKGSAVHSSEHSPNEWRRVGRHCKHNNGVFVGKAASVYSFFPRFNLLQLVENLVSRRANNALNPTPPPAVKRFPG